MLKLSLALGVTGGGVCWQDGDEGDTEKRLSLPMTLITWLFGLWGRRGLIYIERRERAQGLLWAELHFHLNSYVEVLTPITLEYDLNWK